MAQSYTLDKDFKFPPFVVLIFFFQVGIPTIGFAPIDQVEMLAHENNEFLNKKMFLKGIEIYKNILTSLDNVRT